MLFYYSQWHHCYSRKVIFFIAILDDIITQVILAFWLVLAYGLLEDRRTIDIIIKKNSPSCFKMAESFENLDNILRGWAKDKKQKKNSQGIEEVRKPGRGKIKPFLLKNDLEKNSSSLCRRSSETKSNTKLVLVNLKPSLYLEFNKRNKQNVSEINSFKKFNFSQC